MDDKRFDELSRRLAVPLTRAGFFKTLSALGGSALAAITGLDLVEAKKGRGARAEGKGGKKGKKKGHGKKKGNRSQQSNGQLARNDSPVTGQAACGVLALCHCSPPDNPEN